MGSKSGFGLKHHENCGAIISFSKQQSSLVFALKHTIAYKYVQYIYNSQIQLSHFILYKK